MPVRPLHLIWTRPRAAFRLLLDTGGRGWSWLPLCVAATVTDTLALGQAQVALPAPLTSVGRALLGGLILGPLLLYAATSGLFVFGLMLKGSATFRQLRAVRAWASLPVALLVVAWLPYTLLGGGQGAEARFMQAILGIATVIAGGWSVVLLVVGLAEAERSTIGRACLQALGAFVPLWAALAFTLGVLILLLRSAHFVW